MGKPFGPSLVRNLVEGGFRTCSVGPLTPSVMAHPSTPLFLLAAVAFAAPDVLATPVQGLRGAISNSTGEARHLSDPGADVESGGNPGDNLESGGETCCKNGNDDTKCEITNNNRWSVVCNDKVDGSGCERQDEGRDAAGCFCGSLRPPGARNAAHGKIASLVSPRISMSGFSTERPPAGPHSAPRAHGDNVA